MKYITKRPGKDHPNPSYWSDLRKSVMDEQKETCATCWNTNENMQLELHHRHYNNFGSEDRLDVILLCKLCHEAITSSIRDRRYGEKEILLIPTATQSIQGAMISYEKPKLD